MNRPWHKRAAELESKEGPWCDYAAWLEWFKEREGRHAEAGGDMLADMDFSDLTTLYCIFYEIFDSLPDLPEFIEGKAVDNV